MPYQIGAYVGSGTTERLAASDSATELRRTDFMNILVKIRQYSPVIVAFALSLGVVAFLQIRSDSSLVEESVTSAEPDGLRRSPAEMSSTFSAEGMPGGKPSIETSRMINDGIAASPLLDSVGNIEASLIANNEIDLVWYRENNKSGDVFEKLVEELRNTTGLDASEQREKYEELFLSPQQTQNGSVTLETLECGKNICAVVFSGNDDALLNAYAKAVFTSETFEASAIFQPYWDAGELPDVYRRYIFSHNSEIDTIRSADRKFVINRSK